MSDAPDLSCHAKLARVVLDNRGPLSPAEVATEARIAEVDAETALEELESVGLADCVCGVCETREVVYELNADENADSAGRA